MFWALTLILLAVAAFSLVVVRRPRPRSYDHDPRLAVDQLQGFVYVGAAVLVLISVGVVLLGLLDAGHGRAEALAVLGFIGYGLYLAASAVALYVLNRPAPAPRWPAPSVPSPQVDRVRPEV